MHLTILAKNPCYTPLMRKLSLLLIPLLLFACTPAEQISPKEQEFNKSGRAKAIEKPSDLWMHYEDPIAGFSVKYPHNVIMNGDDDALHLTITQKHVKLLRDTMGFTEDIAKKNYVALAQGEYGENVDWPLDASKNVRPVGDTFAQDFLVLGRFEVCDVTFERKLYFFHKDRQIVLTVRGPKDAIKTSSPEYFTQDPENCGEELMWDLNAEANDAFYSALQNDEASEEAIEWYETFDQIVETIELFEPREEEPFLEEKILLQSTWTSVDDPKSQIVFEDDLIAGVYEEELLSSDAFTMTDQSPVVEGVQEGPYIIVGQDEETFIYAILKLTEEELELMYLPRGNILRYAR
jgi:hypothetical protein